MKIGFANIYSFRPHVEHLYFLSELLKNNGHDVHFLTCDSSVKVCYPVLLKESSKLRECSKCIIGGVRSFTGKNVSSIGKEESNLPKDVLDGIALSSSCTLTRTESEEEWNDSEVSDIRQRLHQPVSQVYASALKWIEINKLEAVICFNGRMELTRAITYACEAKGIPFVTHERSWFGDGLRLVPNQNCLSISEMNRLLTTFSDKPLLQAQAEEAAVLIAKRFLQQNDLEWRLYNKNPTSTDWPLDTPGKRILIVPSSKNEFAGHPEYQSEWIDNTHAIDDFIDAAGYSNDQVVVRCHPNWAENIGKVEGNRSLNLYKKWADARGIHLISSEAKTSTYDLIQAADIVVLNGGSSAVEAGACGKEVVCLSPCAYQESGFVRVYLNKKDIMLSKNESWISSDQIVRKTLRYVYLRYKRSPQFVDFVKAIKTTKYKYYKNADANRLINLLKTGKIVADDERYSEVETSEDFVVQLLREKKWEAIVDMNKPVSSKLEELPITRRFGFRWIDGLRDRLPRGDR